MRIVIAFMLYVGLLLAMPACNAQPKGMLNLNSKGIAIQGYDPVAYFTKSAPTKGNPQISAKHDGAIYLFASTTHRDTFLVNPEKYVPAYGGYCAYGVAKGYTVKIDPASWAVENGVLYLNYDKKVQNDWNKERKMYISDANKQWVKMVSSKKQ